MMIKENIQHLTQVSGHDCLLNAHFENGRIKGYICLAYNVKRMNFDFAPLKVFALKQLLFLELKRLYLDYRPDESGTHRIVLDVL